MPTEILPEAFGGPLENPFFTPDDLEKLKSLTTRIAAGIEGESFADNHEAALNRLKDSYLQALEEALPLAAKEGLKAEVERRAAGGVTLRGFATIFSNIMGKWMGDREEINKWAQSLARTKRVPLQVGIPRVQKARGRYVLNVLQAAANQIENAPIPAPSATPSPPRFRYQIRFKLNSLLSDKNSAFWRLRSMFARDEQGKIMGGILEVLIQIDATEDPKAVGAKVGEAKALIATYIQDQLKGRRFPQEFDPIQASPTYNNELETLLLQKKVEESFRCFVEYAEDKTFTTIWDSMAFRRIGEVQKDGKSSVLFWSYFEAVYIVGKPKIDKGPLTFFSENEIVESQRFKTLLELEEGGFSLQRLGFVHGVWDI